MGLYSPIPVIVIPMISIGTSILIFTYLHFPLEKDRILSIDGLRGYLALGVFIEHSANWYLYRKTGLWLPLKSNLYQSLGNIGIMFFFMITGFLFWSRLIRDENTSLDWVKLYIARLLRLTPLYFFVVSIILLIVFIKTHFIIREKISSLLTEIFQWYSFTIGGRPNINGLKDTSIICGVVWTLPYEWLFYISLPFMGLFFRKHNQYLSSLIALIGIIFLYIVMHLSKDVWFSYSPQLLSAFLGGIFVAYIVKLKASEILKNSFFSWISILILCLIFYLTTDPWNTIGIIACSFIFLVIASGNSFFGILTLKSSRVLGEISYSIYLIHPLLLFSLFEFLMPQKTPIRPTTHWLSIFLLIPFLILCCYFTYTKIEYPFIKLTGRVNSFIRGIIGDRRKP